MIVFCPFSFFAFYLCLDCEFPLGEGIESLRHSGGLNRSLRWLQRASHGTGELGSQVEGLELLVGVELSYLQLLLLTNHEQDASNGLANHAAGVSQRIKRQIY